MSDDPNDPIRKAIQQALRRQAPEDFEAIKQGQYEEEVVKFFLRRFNAMAWKTELLDICNVEQGVRRLRLTYFNRLFDNFPVLLATKHIAKVTEKVNTRLLFSDFENLPFVAALDEHFDNVKDEAARSGKAVGLICKWPYLKGGLVIHNANIELDRPGTRMCWVKESDHAKLSKRKVARRLVIEDLSSFCEAIRNWRPEID